MIEQRVFERLGLPNNDQALMTNAQFRDSLVIGHWVLVIFWLTTHYWDTTHHYWGLAGFRGNDTLARLPQVGLSRIE